jgi:hypothetical protein
LQESTVELEIAAAMNFRDLDLLIKITIAAAIFAMNHGVRLGATAEPRFN